MPFSKEQAAGETLYCCVCGMGSCRKKWDKHRGSGRLRFVACARHTDAEFSEGYQRALIRTGKTLSEGPPTSGKWGGRATRRVQ